MRAPSPKCDFTEPLIEMVTINTVWISPTLRAGSLIGWSGCWQANGSSYVFPDIHPAAEGKGSNRKQGKNQMVFLAGDNYRERP